MKIMNYKTLFTVLLVLFVALTGCSKESDRNPDTSGDRDTDAQESQAGDPIDNFNTVWISENYAGTDFDNPDPTVGDNPLIPTLLAAQPRTIANFVGYNTAVKTTLTCEYGRVENEVEDGADEVCYYGGGGSLCEIEIIFIVGNLTGDYITELFHYLDDYDDNHSFEELLLVAASGESFTAEMPCHAVAGIPYDANQIVLNYEYADPRAYFAYSDVEWFESDSDIEPVPVPAPKRMGGGIDSFKITFAANVNEYESTREIVEGDAYLRIDLQANNTDVFSVVFSNIKASLNITNDKQLSATWKDNCGDIKIIATVDGDKLTNPKLTYYNYPVSYLNPGCYHKQDMPIIIRRLINDPNYSMPRSLPVEIDVDSSSSMGWLFKGVYMDDETKITGSIIKPLVETH